MFNWQQIDKLKSYYKIKVKNIYRIVICYVIQNVGNTYFLDTLTLIDVLMFSTDKEGNHYRIKYLFWTMHHHLVLYPMKWLTFYWIWRWQCLQMAFLWKWIRRAKTLEQIQWFRKAKFSNKIQFKDVFSKIGCSWNDAYFIGPGNGRASADVENSRI